MLLAAVCLLFVVCYSLLVVARWSCVVCCL